MSALNTMNDNILKFCETEENLEQEESNREFKSKFEEIKHKIISKGVKKKMRNDNFKKVDWQMKRLPNLARALNEFFCFRKK